MSIAISAVTTKASTGTVTSLATASISPTADSLILATVVSRLGSSVDPTEPTLSGNGLTWVVVGTSVFDNTSSSRRRITLFRSLGASPSAGALTADFAGQSQTSSLIVVDEASGVDTSGTNGSGAVVQSAVNQDTSGSASSLTVTLGSFSGAGNATYGTFGYANPTYDATAGSGFTRLGNVVDSVPDIRGTTEYLLGNDTSVDMTWGSGGEVGGIAIEIKEAVAAVTTHFLASMGVGT